MDDEVRMYVWLNSGIYGQSGRNKPIKTKIMPNITLPKS